MENATTAPSTQELSWRTVCFATVILVACFGLRLAAPWQATDSMAAYEGITQAIVQQQNWGKQAIVGALEYPPLPAVGLLLLKPLNLTGPASLVPLSHVLVALCQTWTLALVYLIVRIGIPRRDVSALLAVGLVALTATGLPGTGAMQPLRTDPFWVCLVPLAGYILFLLRWLCHRNLRDLMYFSLLSGLLAFCGPAGYLIAGFTTLGLVTTCRKEMAANRATTLLLAMPLLYATILHWLFNLLIMEDGLFGIKRLVGYMGVGKSLSPIPMNAILGILGAITITGWLKRVTIPRVTWLYVLALFPVILMRESGRIFIGGEFLFAGFAAVPLLAGILASPKPFGRISADQLSAAAVGVFAAACLPFIQQRALAYEDFSKGTRPTKEELIAYVDSRWKGSRFLVFGLRSCLLYCTSRSADPKVRDRFIGRLDLNRNVLAQDIQVEQLHILVPPDNGMYYPSDSFFSRLHGAEQPEWLFLEKTWGHGGRESWQLWRCIRRTGESGNL